MMTKKKLAEIKAEVKSLLARLPGRSARAWLNKEIAAAQTDRNRDVETLTMLCAALEDEVGHHTHTKVKAGRKAAKS